MAVRYRSLGGGLRAWSIDTWADFTSIPVAFVNEGDTLYYVAGKVSMTRRASRWRPDEADLWGRNDMVTVPFGSINSEGVWTVGSGNPGMEFDIEYQNKWNDCLAIITSGTTGFILRPSTLDGTPRFLGFRCVYIPQPFTVNAYNGGLRGADSVIPGLGHGNYAHGESAVCRANQCCVAPGGTGGTAESWADGGGSLYDPGVDDMSESPGTAPIVNWGGFYFETQPKPAPSS
jgi:hypothetical protein